MYYTWITIEESRCVEYADTACVTINSRSLERSGLEDGCKINTMTH